MARKKNIAHQTNNNEGWKKKVHTLYFSMEEEFEIQAWYGTSELSWHLALEELVSDDLSVRINPPSTGDDYWASATFKSKEDTYHGHTFSVKYPDMEIAVLILYWAITVYVEEGRFQLEEETGSRDWLKTSAKTGKK